MPKPVEHIHGQTYIGGLNRVFHCNYYNGYLQTAALMSEGAPDCDPKRLLYEAVIPLVQHLRKKGYSETDLVEEFSFCGFGKLRKMLDGGWVTTTSHYGQSAALQGKPQASCFFNAGYIAGMTDHEVTETVCRRQGGPADWYMSGAPLPSIPNYLKAPPKFLDAPARFDFTDCQKFDTVIDEAAIIEAVAGLPLYGKMGPNDTGLIDAFGVVLTNHFADYYNYVSYQSYVGMLKAGMPPAAIRDVFVQGGHICAFHTFGGIMSSPEWYALIAPNCRSDEDWVHGMVAVINALGWGTWRVESIDPGHEMIIRIYNSYEGVGYRRMYAPSKETQLSFLAMGATQGLAHLLWKIDIKERPTLDQHFYASVFNTPEGHFEVEQTHAIAAGHNYDRIRVWRD